MNKLLTLVFLFLFCTSSYNAGAQVLLKENFEAATVPPTGWTVSGNTWYSNSIAENTLSGARSLQTYPYSGTDRFDSWMMSPAVPVVAGNTYRVSYWYKTNKSANTKKMNITWGGKNVVDSQLNILHKYSGITNANFKEGVDTFIASGTGNIYFGLYIKDTLNYIGETFIDSFVVQQLSGNSCTGVPVPGTVSGPSEYCISQPVKLILSGIYTGLNYRFEWYSTPAGQNNFSLIAGATGTVLYNSQLIPLDYRCKIICNNTGQFAWSNTFSIVDSTFCYCWPGVAHCGISGGGTISWFDFGGISTGSYYCNYPGYTDNTLTSPAANITAGTTVPISINVSYNSDFKLAAWIDYNRNGIFESDEFTNLGAIDANILHRNIIVPANAVGGKSRMRLRSQYWSNWNAADACKEIQYGETEDCTVNITAYPACAGIPEQGLVAAPDSVCSQTAFNLSLSNNYDYTGLSFQWQSTTDLSVNFSDISGAVAKTSFVTQNNKTYYRCKITCNNSGLFSYSNIDSVAASLCYCVAKNSPISGGVITSVSIATMQNNSVYGSGYDYYGNTVAAPLIKKGATYILSVRIIQNNKDAFYAGCWVDFDANGIFSANEIVYSGLSDSSNLRIPVTIPLTAATGKLGIRIRTDKFAAVAADAACTQYNFGEVEDYLLNVQPAATCSGTPSGISTAGPAVACQGLPFNVYLTGNYAEPGYTCAWQSSVAGANTFITITGADQPVLSASLTAATDYRCRITCLTSGLSFITNIISVQPVICYCTPVVQCNYNGYISNVSMGGVNNTSTTCYTYGYSDFINLAPATDTAGTKMPVTITSVGSGYFGIWIDYNRDGFFAATEYSSIGYKTAGTNTSNIFIPSNILPGNTRMRICFKTSGGSVNAVADACNKDGYGEVEDYRINILSAPIAILHTPVIDTLYDPVINITANIRQWTSGVNNSDSLRPRIWVKRAGTSLWKNFKGALVSGDTNNGEWKFSIESDSVGLRRNGCDSVSYYIVAQDLDTAVHIGYYPETGARHLNVYTQITVPQTPLGLRITPRMKDTVYISQSDCRFNSFSGDNGLFQHINNRGLEGNMCVMIESDLDENGTNELDGAAMNNYSIIVKPAHDSINVRCTLNSTTGGTIILNAVKNFTIDGSARGNNSRGLLFSNPLGWGFSDESGMIKIYNSCSNVSIRNCKMDFDPYGAISTVEGPVLITNGNNTRLSFENNLFEHNSTSIQMANVINSVKGNNQATVRGNEFNNFFGSAVNVVDSCAGWIIDSNHFYRTVIPQGYAYDYADGFVAVKVAGSGHLISGNYIGGSAPFCAGSSLPFVSGSFKGIYVTGSAGPLAVTIKNNRIDNIKESSLATASSDYTFYGILVSNNKVIVKDNVIGNPNVAGYSISMPATELSGIVVWSKNDCEISGNSIASITNKTLGVISYVTITGISAISYGELSFITSPVASFKVSNNRVLNIRNTENWGPAHSESDYHGGTMGIYVSGGHNNLVEKNTIHDLLCTQNQMSGIYYVAVAGDTLSAISANRIYGLVNTSTAYITCCSGSDDYYNPGINGISLNTTAPIDIINNQISINNANLTTAATIRGIFSSPQYPPAITHQRMVYNSIYIGGQATQNGGSTAYWSFTLPIQFIYNNFFYNERTGGNQGHYIYRVNNLNPLNFFGNAGINNNLYLLADTSGFAQWSYASTAQKVGWQRWKQQTQKDAASYWSYPSIIPSEIIFKNSDTANLHINTDTNLCWAVNGKALPISQISADFDSANVRSVSVADGASDIGADEFSTTTLPPALVITQHRVLGGSDTLTQNGRVLAVINWGNTGILPVLGIPRVYTGVWPHDISNGGQSDSLLVMNTWWDIPATGGSNYTYSVELWYDSSMLGKIRQQQNMVVNKRAHNAAGSWESLLPASVNNSAHIMIAPAIAAFSEFSAAEGGSSLGNFGKSICAGAAVNFIAYKKGAGFTYQWQVDTGNGFANIADGGIYSGSSDSVLTISGAVSSMNEYKFRCISTFGGVSSFGEVYTLKIAVIWTGAVNSDWLNAGNWNCGITPDGKTNVIIPSGLAVYPVVTQNVSCNRLVISQGATVAVNSGVSITILAH